MAYDPGALEAALAAAVGNDPTLVAELRIAFFASARAHVRAIEAASDAAGRRDAAVRLKSLAASFGALRVMDAADSAAQAEGRDGAPLAAIRRAIAALAITP